MIGGGHYGKRAHAARVMAHSTLKMIDINLSVKERSAGGEVREG